MALDRAKRAVMDAGKKVGEKAGELAKETGERMIGRGAEVRFRHEVKKYATENGVSEKQAAKAVFSERIDRMDQAILRGEALGKRSEAFREFQGALRETLGRDAPERLRKEASDPAVCRALTITSPDRDEVGASLEMWKQAFAGRMPRDRVVQDTAEQIKLMQVVFDEIRSDPSLAGPDSLRDALAARPELGADIGKALIAKDTLEMHERMFTRTLAFERSREAFIKTGKEALATMFWRAPVDWFKGFAKSVAPPSLATPFRIAYETMRLAVREVWSGSRILARGLEVTARGLNTLRH